MKKIIILSVLLFFTSQSHASKTTAFFGVEHRELIREDILRESVEYGDYHIKIYRDGDIGTFGILRIFKNGALVFEEERHSYFLGAGDGDSRLEYYPEIGQDITGDGEPNLLVSHWSGGAHCCYDVYIFSIGDEFRFIDKIEGAHGVVSFKDLNADSIYESITCDWAFAYWHECFAGSPAPQVVLSYNNGVYQPDFNLMKRPLPDIEKEYTERANDDYYQEDCTDKSFWWKKNGACVKTPVWTHMLNLIYGGYPNLAWKFLDDVWESDEQTKTDFIVDFKRQLSLSRYADWLPVDLEGYGSNTRDEADKE
ncbi:MAG: hypothetical protein K8S27_04765 [Candidatus Omnitrophica bacterium]|nr:hypothetical protein [Candidatus Omnitrophota bacterium]